MMTLSYAIGIVLALVVGGSIGLLLTAAHYQRAGSRQLRFEQEIAQDAELYLAARAMLQRYRQTGPRGNDATAP